MSKLYKYSQFNIEITKEENKVYIFNTYSSKGQWLDKEEQGLIFNKLDIDPLDIRQEIISDGLVVPVDYDEVQAVKDKAHYVAHNANVLCMVIATTMACPFNCSYCFEKQALCNNSKMTHETADKLVEFIGNTIIEHPQINNIHLRWFGGEPLLNTEIIEYISGKLDSKNIKYTSEIYTNGRLLSKENVELLVRNHVHKIDIALDGLAELYAKQKGCTTKDFDIVIENLKYAQDKIEWIDLKINITEESKDSAMELVRYLYEDCDITIPVRMKEIVLYDNEACSACYATPYLEMITLNEKLFDYQKEKNIGYSKATYPVRRACTCEASYDTNFVIAPDGDVYRCSHFYGNKDYVVGNIFTGLTHPESERMLIDNKLKDKCYECPVLPACMGGCTIQNEIYNLERDCENIINSMKLRVKYSDTM